MDFQNKLKRFCGRFSATYRLTPKVVRYAVRDGFGHKLSDLVDLKYDQEYIVSLEMPESAVKSLINFCDQMDKQNFNQYVLKILDQQQQDEQIRLRNAGVQQAYERYKLMLELAR